MLHPFQCLVTANPSGSKNVLLLSACGPKLIVTGFMGEPSPVFEWSAEASSAQSSSNQQKEGERPSKKQKTENPPPTAPNVIKLTVSPDSQHVVAVTDDKCVRVFRIHEDGKLEELSQRFMPKRPCAIQVLPDNATILCGDKFGDVYSLPLIPAETVDGVATAGGAEDEDSSKAVESFKPSATTTTVHTQRNRKALEAQIKQKNLTPKTKEPLKFEHKLLLGHVSMLTDLTFATKEVDGKQRGYIVTADRDEHIRFSRAPPQSHIIEGYCLGHTEFVSKICLVPGTDLLVSGGGDEWIGLWDWPSFKLRRKIDLLGAINASIRSRSGGDEPAAHTYENIAISGIWLVPITSSQGRNETVEQAILVACEKVPHIAVLPVANLCKEDAVFDVWPVGHPVLDLTCVRDSILMSHDSPDEDKYLCIGSSLSYFSPADQVNLVPDCRLHDSVQVLSAVNFEVKNDKQLDNLLWGVANMRKRGYHNGEEEEVVEEGGAE